MSLKRTTVAGLVLLGVNCHPPIKQMPIQVNAPLIEEKPYSEQKLGELITSDPQKVRCLVRTVIDSLRRNRYPLSVDGLEREEQVFFETLKAADLSKMVAIQLGLNALVNYAWLQVTPPEKQEPLSTAVMLSVATMNMMGLLSVAMHDSAPEVFVRYFTNTNNVPMSEQRRAYNICSQ